MIGAWMVQAIVVGALLSGAAALAEHALRLGARPARGVWIAALAGTLLLPAWAALRPAPSSGAIGLDGASVVDGGAVVAPARPLLPRLPSLRSLYVHRRFDRPLGTLWLALSAGIAGAGAVGLTRLARARRRWRAASVDGREVLLSPRFGPAVIGLLRPTIVLPRWALALDARDRALVLAHEDEHRRARDPLLLALGALAVAASPWNPWVWLQARRLRAAVELDCDRRVLARGVQPVAYGGLLLRVGSRAGRGVGALSAALTGRTRSILERRLTMITRVRDGRWQTRAGAATAAAAALLALACETPSPTATSAPIGLSQEQLARRMPRASPLRAPGDGAEVMARPLVFVDGVEVDDGRRPLAGRALDSAAMIEMWGLNPDMIERIEVIKGVAAVEHFGERARDGVIQITTKQGARPISRAAAPPTQPVARGDVRLNLEARGTKVYVDGRLTPAMQVDLAPDRIERIEMATDAAARAIDPDAQRIVWITTKK